MVLSSQGREEMSGLKKMCVIYRRGGVDAAIKVLAPDEKSARNVFYSNRLRYAGCGTEVLKIEEYDGRQHDRLIRAGQNARRV